MPSQFGYESIIENVFQKSLKKWRVHISGPSFTDYLCTSVISECTDTDASKAPWIHACKKGKKFYRKSLPCQTGEFEVCQIKPNAAYFSQKKMAELEKEGHDPGMTVSHGGSNFKVCYSNYASLAEIEKFVNHFRPEQITPCAMPYQSTRDDLQNILASILETCQPYKDETPSASDNNLNSEASEPKTARYFSYSSSLLFSNLFPSSFFS